MDALRHGPHSAFSIHLHPVWVTEYRKPALAGAVGVRVRDLIREICGTLDVLIIRGHVSEDHVHLLVSIPPQVAVSRLVQRLKGKTAYKLLAEFAHLREQFWGRHLWARGYFCRSSGQVTDEVVKEYIENQGREMRHRHPQPRGGLSGLESRCRRTYEVITPVCR
jgi:putative transposase